VPPTLFVDPQSPYAYLAATRAPAVLGVAPRLEVVLLGALFPRRGHRSWAHGPDRAEHEAELQRRAAARGLPPLTLPEGWPAQSLAPARAATWALRAGAAAPYLRAYWNEVFALGRPADAPATLRAAAAAAGLDGDALLAGLHDPAVKAALRAATDAAWDRGVRTIPTLERDGALHPGDDALDALRARPDVTAVAIDAMEATFRGSMRKVRAELGLTSFGVQAIDLPPGFDRAPAHDHRGDGQEELYLAIRGAGALELGGGGDRVALEQQHPVRVGPGETRRLVAGPDGLRVLVVGGVPGRAYAAPPVTELGAVDPMRRRD